MAALLADIFLWKEHMFVEVGIEVRLHQRIRDGCCPPHEVVYCPLGTIGIVNLQTVALCHDVVADGMQTVGSLTGQQCRRLLVTVDALSHEVIGAEVSYFQNRIRHDVCQCYKPTAVVRRTPGLVFPLVGKEDEKHDTAKQYRGYNNN